LTPADRWGPARLSALVVGDANCSLVLHLSTGFRCLTPADRWGPARLSALVVGDAIISLRSIALPDFAAPFVEAHKQFQEVPTLLGA
jgi:hypothetical protein